MSARVSLLGLVGSLVLTVTVGGPIGAAQEVTAVVEFDAVAGELPEGLVFDGDGNLYVGMAPSGEIKKITPQGAVSTLARLPSPPGFLTGLEWQGSYVFAAVVSEDPAVHGIWQVPLDGRSAQRFAALDPGFPNGLAFWDGQLYVSDSALGRVWRISPEGAVTVWAQHDGLLGDPTGPLVGFPVGANGIAFQGDWLYVANMDFGRIVRVRVNEDGSAGELETYLDFPRLLQGADGLAWDETGNLYIAVNVANRIVRVSTASEVTILSGGSPFQFPASLAVWDSNLYITNFALLNAMGALSDPPEPALLRMSLP